MHNGKIRSTVAALQFAQGADVVISETPDGDFYLPATLNRTADGLAVLSIALSSRVFDPADAGDLAALQRIVAEVVELVDPVFQAVAVIGGFQQSEIDDATIPGTLALIEALARRAAAVRQQRGPVGNDNGA